MQGRSRGGDIPGAPEGGARAEDGRLGPDAAAVLEAARVVALVLDADLSIRSFTPAAAGVFNLGSGDVGRRFTDIADRFATAELGADLERVLATGEAAERRLRSDSAGRHFLLRLAPCGRDGGASGGVVLALTDVTPIAEAEARQQTVIAELNHRIKNMLAVVISIAANTLEEAPPHPSHEALLGRLRALGRICGSLSLTGWTRMACGDIVRKEAAPYGAERFRLAGPRLMLDPQRALSLGMVIHELATNAAKYGALSVPGGRVAVRWGKQAGAIIIHWQEQDGPPVAAEPRPGLGLSLLEGEIAYRHGGTVVTEFHRSGLSVTLTLPE